jgi:5-methylcytosine-specific restriction endonuclease McrA
MRAQAIVTKPPKKRGMKGRHKKTDTTRALVSKLDRVFSRFVRMKYADNDGQVSCVTCGKQAHWKEVHAGHFVKRQHMSLRWDERNVMPQCVRCNLHMGGRQDDYAAYIVNEYGHATFADLIAKKHETKKWTRPELQELIDIYSERVRVLENCRKFLV